VAKLVYRELTAEAFCHATEAEDRVAKALAAVAPGARVERKALGGHFGQPLVQLTATFREGPAIAAAVARLKAATGPEIARTAARRLSEDRTLHLRLDKQAAAEGQLRLCDASQGDVVVVRLRMRAPRLSTEEAVLLVQREFGTPQGPEEE
jgi:RNA binding exosome subunit